MAIRRVLLGIILIVTSLTSSALVFTKGAASADLGVASYSVPLTVPPGTANLAPSLSLQFSSAGGNGLLGIGWSLGIPPALRAFRLGALG